MIGYCSKTSWKSRRNSQKITDQFFEKYAKVAGVSQTILEAEAAAQAAVGIVLLGKNALKLLKKVPKSAVEFVPLAAGAAATAANTGKQPPESPGSPAGSAPPPESYAESTVHYSTRRNF